MKKGFVYGALCALALAAPATAERIYVPVLGTTAGGDALATKVRITQAEGPVAARFRDASGVDGLESEQAITVQPAAKALANLSPAGRDGLITLDAESDFDASAWTVNRAGRAAEAEVFTDEEVYSAGVNVPLSDLPRPRVLSTLSVGAANVSEQAASCRATLLRPDGSTAAEIPFDVAPMSLARKDGLAAAAGSRVGSVSVTCDQSFYPFAVATDKSGKSPIMAKGIGPNGACKIWLTLTKDPNTGHYTAHTPPAPLGVFHEATKADPKGIVCIKAPAQLNVAKAVYTWDTINGPWSSRDHSGLHNLAYFFLDRYRSGVVGNINEAGPNKNFMKVMQNVGMPRGTNTSAKMNYSMQPNDIYHYIYTFDAANKRATMQVYQNVTLIRSFSFNTQPGNNQTLIIKPFGTGGLAGLAHTAEFGNYIGQHHPEEATIGWKYSNFSIDLTLKQ